MIELAERICLLSSNQTLSSSMQRALLIIDHAHKYYPLVIGHSYEKWLIYRRFSKLDASICNECSIAIVKVISWECEPANEGTLQGIKNIGHLAGYDTLKVGALVQQQTFSASRLCGYVL